MTVATDVEDSVCARVAQTPVVESPFPHQYLRPVFPEPFYRELLSRLPSNEGYTALGETGTLTSRAAYPERLVVDLKALGKRDAGPRAADAAFWSGLSGWMLGTRFLGTLLERYQPYIAARFGEDASIATVSQARLVRDLTNYSLGPHTDAPYKLLSLLFYLPADERRPELGTSMYAPLDPAMRCAGGPHHPFERFRRLSTMAFLPNALFVFFKNDVAFHGVEPVRETGARRDAIQYNVYVTRVLRGSVEAPIPA